MKHDARRAHVLESLAELYLRLNGYFSIRNYLQHRVAGFGLETESDLLAIRMAYQVEVLEDGRHQPHDSTLILPPETAAIDCIIAEVKEPSVEFNAPIGRPDGSRLIEALLRMFGILPQNAFDDGGAGRQVAADLHSLVNNHSWPEIPMRDSIEHRASFRMLVFAPQTARHANERKHIDLQHVLDFVRSRMRPDEPCARYRDAAFPSASPWRGCTQLIVEALDDFHVHGQVDFRFDDFITAVLSRWHT
jgi:hypothetical protein